MLPTTLINSSWDHFQAGALLLLWGLPLVWSFALSVCAAWRMRFSPRAAAPPRPPAFAIVVPSQPTHPLLESCIDRALSESLGRGTLHLCLSMPPGYTLPDGRFRHPNIAVTSSESVDKLALIATADLAGADSVLLLDDNIRISASQIAEQFYLLTQGAVAVAAPVFAIEPAGWWSRIDAAIVNGYFTRMQLAGDFVGLRYLTGKALVIKRQQLSQFLDGTRGKFILCDDAALQRYIEQTEGRIALSHRPCFQSIGYRMAQDVWERHKRWGICRKENVPWLFFSEPLLFPLTSLVASFVAGGIWLGSSTGAFIASLMAFWAFEAAFLLASKSSIDLRFPFVWLARELFLPLLWISSLLSRRLIWRANCYRKVAGEWIYLDP